MAVDEDRDAAWLAEVWPQLGTYEGSWIAVFDAAILASDEDLERLGRVVDDKGVDAMFAFVTYDPIA
jgi:hypothetical protein